MKIAVVGSGIAGLSAAWLLSRERHQVTLFERDARLGGHTHTHKVAMDGREFAVDTGFIVFNNENYPLLVRMFNELGVATQATTMSFSVQDARNGLEYNAGSLGGLFAQPRNLLAPKFLRMLGEIKRFYREAQTVLDAPGAGPLLGEYLREAKFSPLFIEDHLIPMISALWSAPSRQVMEFPAKYLLRFMANHDMLKANGRPQWRTVKGGSSRYIDMMRTQWKVRERLNTPVLSVNRDEDDVRIGTADGEERFDHVVMACHSDQALAMLGDASDLERDILGAIPYQANEAVLHTDPRLLPKKQKSWAAWNAYVSGDSAQPCTVSYYLNALQSLDAPEPIIVTLNRTQDIDPDKIIARMTYHHPVYTRDSINAQNRRGAINGLRRTWFAGAYWRYGFHEDGLRSAVSIARGLDVEW